MTTRRSNALQADSEQDSVAAGICLRILNDMILELARRHGVGAVVLALTEIVGCQSCIDDKADGDSVRALLERMKP